MAATWKHGDVFPIIAQNISDAHASLHRFVRHDEIVERLLADSEAAPIIDQAQRKQVGQPHSAEWLAHNMVAWFSQNITVGQSDWGNAFRRRKIDGKWAYAQIKRVD